MTGSICVVGAGETGIRLVERIRANAAKAGTRHPLEVHLVDPDAPPPGAVGPDPQAPGLRIHLHRAGAIDLAGRRVLLDDGTRVDTDAVVLAQGWPDVLPSAREQELRHFARENGLYYRPAGHVADRPLEQVPGGEPVLALGLGSVLADVLTRLTVARGGRFRHGADGELIYQASGREPLVHVGSVRGVPPHAQVGYRLTGERPPPPRFVTRLGEGARGFREEVWPLVAKDLASAYYHHLLTVHPDRARVGWDAFAGAFEAEEWDGRAMRALIRTAVPRFEDRLNFARLDRPLAGMRFGDLAGLQRWMHGYLSADLSRRADPSHSADLAMIHALRDVLDFLTGRVPEDAWFHRLARHTAGTLPAGRIAELRALARARVVTFLGAETRVEPTREGLWRATSATVPGAVTARAFIEARRPGPSLDRTRDPLLRRLYARGECAEESGRLKVSLPGHRIVDQNGTAHPYRFALGPWTTGGHPLSADDPAIRHADTLARTLLTTTANPRVARVA
ncbi:adenylate cyclase [Sphaerisporangium album]|uniref:adenylate cyclase n=1 Tax=Sphaerisporangium album TaxID=509200 RepID=UPI0015EFE6A9|nr:adenylate cyclase [Sphaerisporangium album]